MKQPLRLCWFSLLVWIALSAQSHLLANHLCMGHPVGLIAAEQQRIEHEWKTTDPALNDRLGCALSDERDVPNEDGRYADFAKGQIVWSPSQKLIVSAFAGLEPHSLQVEWRNTERYHYDFYNVLVTWDTGAQLTEDVEPLADGRAGLITLRDLNSGRISIRVQGCDQRLPFSRVLAICRQGYSNPATVDLDALDVSHKADGVSPLEASRKVEEAEGVFKELAKDARVAEAKHPLQSVHGDVTKVDEAFAESALARMHLSFSDMQEVRVRLQEAVPASEVGTSLETSDVMKLCALNIAEYGSPWGGGGILVGAVLGGVVGWMKGGREGDYDMALTALLPLAYGEGNRKLMGEEAYHNLVYGLLNQAGGGGDDEAREKFTVCTVELHETENHILMIQSARYLTNELRRELDPTNPDYWNERNALEDYLLKKLRNYLIQDFHEYNARPYARFSIGALLNLANFSGNSGREGAQKVQRAATLVLDYLAAKFAVSSNGLRRSVPFRRREENASYTSFFGNKGDEETWFFLQLVGNKSVLDHLRYGRADWAAPAAMIQASVGNYRVPNLILGLMLDGSDPCQGPQAEGPTIDFPDSSAHFEPPPRLRYLQAFHHEGVEIYAGQPEFLISGGGRWENNTNVDRIRFNLSESDTNGRALPTALIPRCEGGDLRDLVRIEGHKDEHDRANTCVAPGFACGLNPVVPADDLMRFPSKAGPCRVMSAGLIGEAWDGLGGANGPLGCPVDVEADLNEGKGRFQVFEHGQVLWSEPQNIVFSAFYHRPNHIVVDWKVIQRYQYDFFIVRWDKNGINLGQEDVQSDSQGSRTTGRWSIPLAGPGHYRVTIEGCDSRFLRGAECKQGWTGPMYFDFPSPLSCARSSGPWLFINRSLECGGQAGNEYYVAVYDRECPDSTRCTGQHFGFFEATPRRGSFEDFVNNTKGKDGFGPDVENSYQTYDGRTIVFVPDHNRNEWGISLIDGRPPFSSVVDSSPLASGRLLDSAGKAIYGDGSVVKTEGEGCTVIRNPVTEQALLLDFRKPLDPQEPREVPAPNGHTVNCDTPTPVPPPPVIRIPIPRLVPFHRHIR